MIHASTDSPEPAGQAPQAIGGKTGLAAPVGPGLLTGASDDDPGGIGTYSEVGAQFGYAMLFSYPPSG
jgi:Mn2+/Fe2+ NRAMP family transporter